jgi:hypothetical protein
MVIEYVDFEKKLAELAKQFSRTRFKDCQEKFTDIQSALSALLAEKELPETIKVELRTKLEAALKQVAPVRRDDSILLPTRESAKALLDPLASIIGKAGDYSSLPGQVLYKQIIAFLRSLPSKNFEIPISQEWE